MSIVQLPLTNNRTEMDDQEISLNTTIRQEYVKCGNPNCQNSHGPYLYAYWKQDKKLKKRYVDKNLEAQKDSKANKT